MLTYIRLQRLIILIIGLCFSSVYSITSKAQISEEMPEVYISNDYEEGRNVVADWCYAVLDSAASAYMRYNLREAEYWYKQAPRAIKDSTSLHYYNMIVEATEMRKGKIQPTNHNILNAITYLERSATPRSTKALIMALNACGQYDMFYNRARAVQYFKRMADVSKTTGHKRSFALSTLYQSEAYVRANLYVQAAQKAREALNICEQDNYRYGAFLCRLQLAKIYTTLKSSEMAEFNLRAIEDEGLYESNYFLKLQYLLHKSDQLMTFRRYPESLAVNEEARKLIGLVDTDIFYYQYYLQYAKILTLIFRGEESDAAVYQCERYLPYSEPFENNERYSRHVISLVKAHNCMIRKDYAKAKEYMSTIAYNKELFHHLDFADAYYTTFERIYLGLQEYMMAAQTLNSHSLLNDTVIRLHAQAREADLAYIYQTDPTILKQKDEITQQQEDTKAMETQSALFFFITAIIILVSILVFYINRRREQAEDEKKALELQESLQKEVEAQTNELRKRNDLISLRNADILRSQAYAKRIQQALLPSTEKMVQPGWFSDASITFKPFEITSGDFYWYSKTGDRIIICAGDGVGHGIPGAMMSMVGLTLINDVVHKNGESGTASVIIEKIYQRLFTMLPNLDKHNDIEMTVTIYDTVSKTLNVACSTQSIIITHGEEVIPVYSTRKDAASDDLTFNDEYYELAKNDSIHIYTDGLISTLNDTTMEKLKLVGLVDIIKSSLELIPEKRTDYIRQELNVWKGTSVQTDDILLMDIII